MGIEFNEQSAACPPGTSFDEYETQCGLAAFIQRSCNWILGDLALGLDRDYPDRRDDAWPLWASPEHIDRCKGVSRAYPKDDRNIDATWSIHQHYSKNPDRVRIVASIAAAGMTSDEARKGPPPPEPEPIEESPAVTQEPEPQISVAPAAEEPDEQTVAVEAPRWLLAVDISYYVHAGFGKHGLNTATEVAAWLERMIVRLAEKGLTDFVCCFDGRDNHRKALTAHWEEERRYKFTRVEKEQELKDQMRLMPDLLAKNNRPCVFIDTMEADDVMASYAVQFPGRVTMLTKDKDMRQCLTKKTNMLADVTWETNAETGVLLPVYHWVVGKFPDDKEKPDNVSCHTKDGLTYQSTHVAGIPPEIWTHFQAIAGDTGDNVQGVKGIGPKGGMDLILHHGTVQGVIDACKAGTATVYDTKGKTDKPLSVKLTQAVLDFEPFAELMLQLVTLRTDLSVPMVTKLCLQDD